MGVGSLDFVIGRSFEGCPLTICICTIMSGSQVTSRSMATSLSIETICDPLSSRDSTSPTPLIKGYTALNPCDSLATTIFLGFFPSGNMFRYWTTRSPITKAPLGMSFVFSFYISYEASGTFSMYITASVSFVNNHYFFIFGYIYFNSCTTHIHFQIYCYLEPSLWLIF